jgi:hypothetical protein
VDTQSQVYSEDAARTVLDAGMTPMSAEEAMASLRRAFPPGATVYSLGLTRPADDAQIVAVFERVRHGIAYSVLAGRRTKPYFHNLSWHVARVGGCSLADDAGRPALRLPQDATVLGVLERTIWLEPTVELQIGRRRRRGMQRMIRRQSEEAEAQFKYAEWHPAPDSYPYKRYLFHHEEIV